MMKTQPPKFTRQIEGAYFQAVDGSWWLQNPQRGWLPVNENGRAFRFYLALADAVQK